MKVHLKNGNKDITIDEKKDYFAAGGEGTVYLKGGFIFKVAHDPTKMIPEAKLTELMTLKRDNLIVPVDVLMDKKNALIGYVMPFVDGIELCRTFNTAFLTDNNINGQMQSALVDCIVESVQFVHDQDSLIVDWNEMNFLVDKAFTVPYFIDTNAWKTKSFPPCAITPLFQDHCTKDFSKLTDWYGFGILACKMFLGIHPFKGSHPKYGRAHDDVIKRMHDCVSIFNKDSKVPAAARSFDNVPDAYMKWFLEIFESSKRLPPPNVAGYVTVIKKKIESIFKFFESDLYKLTQKEVKRFYVVNGVEIVFHDDEIVVGHKSVPIKNNKIKIGVLVSPRDKVPYFVFVAKGKLHVYDVNGNPVGPDLMADDYLVHDHVIYVMSNGRVTQVTCTDFSGKQVFAVGDSWDVTQKSTKTMSNCFLMSIIGKMHMLLPMSMGNKFYLRTLRIPELDDYKVVEAKYDNNVLGVIGVKQGKYDRLMFIIDPLDDRYLMNVDPDIGMPHLNFVVLDNGVGVSMDENGLVNIFTNKYAKYQVKAIKDDSIKSSIRLFKNGVTVLFADGCKIQTLKVAKSA